MRPDPARPDAARPDAKLSFPTSRLRTLTDGIFAIAMTVMALELTAGVREDLELGEMWVVLWPRLVAFALSFGILGLFWIGHLIALEAATQGDASGEEPRLTTRGHLVSSLLFLFWIALIPFPAALIGTHPDEPVSFVVYGAVLTLAAVSLELSWWMRRDVVSSVAGQSLSRRLLLVILAYLGSAALAFVNPYAALAAFAVSHIAFTLRPVLKA